MGHVDSKRTIRAASPRLVTRSGTISGKILSSCHSCWQNPTASRLASSRGDGLQADAVKPYVTGLIAKIENDTSGIRFGRLERSPIELPVSILKRDVG